MSPYSSAIQPIQHWLRCQDNCIVIMFSAFSIGTHVSETHDIDVEYVDSMWSWQSDNANYI
jgi:hypothetical protein